jgi:hypothetical protein
MKSIVQIELTNKCTRCCEYCGHTNMTREKGFMTIETFQRCIYWLKKWGQKDVGLNHYGESLLHPKLTEFLYLCNKEFIFPWLYTNGDLLDGRMIQKLSVFTFKSLIISGHIPREKRQELYWKCTAAGITCFWQVDLKPEGLSNLAGQVPFEAGDAKKPPLKDPINQCRFLKEEKFIVLWNGDIVACCFEYDGKDILGHINDATLPESRVISLCATCPGHPSNTIG